MNYYLYCCLFHNSYLQIDASVVHSFQLNEVMKMLIGHKRHIIPVTIRDAILRTSYQAEVQVFILTFITDMFDIVAYKWQIQLMNQ